MTLVTGWVLSVPRGESRSWALAAAVALATQTARDRAVRYEADDGTCANRFRWRDGSVELIEPREAA